MIMVCVLMCPPCIYCKQFHNTKYTSFHWICTYLFNGQVPVSIIYIIPGAGECGDMIVSDGGWFLKRRDDLKVKSVCIICTMKNKIYYKVTQ